ncbi:uncharacterized membrane-anchored protein YitT (DUF2179 family) [Evansella vedderi]|uniref:Uncharacterized membrane-anchored protein YitT (DUF2179 family) n=1 Tax=Evansella vedderi TaxID=38282 RepID=A0ABT9ZWF1_9BACI|nr:YitT family protein [Evansella vedderi]MDQ0255086.1 uncharacterized membrane-anchored protein YitT (DUF2179 family) [Evansella vedderi]
MNSYILITCGGIIQGMGMALFLFPNKIPSGGAGGLAVLLNFWFNIPLSFALWLVNFSMLVVAIHWLGNASAIGTMYGITVTSISIHFFDYYIYIPPSIIWVDLVIGSAILGLGVGILLRQNVSNGGMGVLALIIAQLKDIPPGKPLLLINGSIFVLTASIIAWEIIFLAIISQWLSTRIVDLVYKVKITKEVTPVMAWRKK